MGTKDEKDDKDMKDDKDEKNINMMRVRSTLANMYTVLCIVLITIGMISMIAVGMELRPFVMISESMHPEVPKGSLVLLDTRAKMTDVAVGDNVAYVLGKVEAMHKTSRLSYDDSGNVDEVVVRSLADEGTSVVTVGTYLGKEVMSIPAVGGWIRQILNYRWVVIVVAVGLVVAGCIPRMKKDTTPRQTVQQE